MLARHRNCKSRSRRVWLNPHNLTLPNDLGRTNDMVSAYCHSEAHITMLGNCGIGLQQDAAETYVIADGPKLRDGVSQIES